MKIIYTAYIERHIRYTLIIFLLLITASQILNAAYLRNVPQTITQPDGTFIQCFASGDEHYNWLHDKDGYTILADSKTGFYVYAKKINGELVSGNIIVGTVDPNTLGIEKWLTIAPEKIYEKAKLFKQVSQKPLKKGNSETIQISGTINNLVIFIRFNDESEFSDAPSIYTDMLNATDNASMKSYFLEVSYNTLTVNSTFYPTPGATILSYKDSHVRSYYKPYHSVNNPTGYNSNDERTTREHSLLMNAVNAVNSQIPPGLNIDSDGNGFVDNICFIIYGAPGGWSDLLWPHQWSLFSYNVTINSKVVWKYNLQLQTVVDAGVLSHEMFHTFGAPDLYHYGFDSKTPVGSWDLMEYDNNPPAHMGAFMKYKYGNWISSIPLISSSGTYQLNPLISSSNNCFRINSPNSATEYFVVEYRRKTGAFESSVPGTGLLVYRIKTDCGNGNSEGPPDEVYIYRFEGTPSVNGNINQAFFSAEVGRTAINDVTNPSCFLYNGSKGGLILYDVGSAGSTISFKIGFGVMPPALKLPVDGADGVSTTPLLVWHKSTDALTYDLQVSTQADLSSPTINYTALTDTSYQISDPLSNGIKYYWRVKAHTAIDTSDWSSIWNFRISLDKPTLVSPVNNSQSRDTSLNLSWSSVFGADWYELQVSNTSDFSNMIKNISNITGTTYDIDGLNKSSKYFWRVNASNPGGTGPWSVPWNFSTIIGPPSLFSPSNHEKRIPDSGYVSWNKNPIAVSYRVQVSRFPDFSVNIYDQYNVTDTSFIYRGFEFGTIYFWRVSSINENDISNWSPQWDFTTILAPPNLLLPVNHATGLTDSISFQWQNVYQAQSYNLQLSSDSTFITNTVSRTEISGLTTNISGLNNNIKYYWRVSAHNSDGEGKWSSIWSFSTSLSPPLLSAPPDGNNFVRISDTLFWKPVNGATNYNIQISKSADFNPVIINDASISNTSYNYSSLENNTKYYWRVAGENSDRTGEWSDVWDFTTRIATPILITPAQNSIKIKPNGMLTWQSIQGAETYSVQLSENNDFSPNDIDASSIQGNSIYYSNLKYETDYFWHVSAYNSEGTTDWSNTWKFTTNQFNSVDAPGNPGIFTLFSYPNPASESVVLDLNLAIDSKVEINLVNLLGEKVKDIFNGYLTHGNHRINWSPGGEITSGIYFVVMTNGIVIQRLAIIIGR